MITGDNIFVAVQTSISLGFVGGGETVLVLEGSRLKGDNSMAGVLVREREGEIEEEEVSI